MNQQTDSTVENVASQAPHPPERPNPPVSSPNPGESPGKDSGANQSAAPEAQNSNAEGSKAQDSEANGADSFRQLPIPPASEPMQYRAIGLIRGKYMPSEEQFTRGNLLTDDGTEVDAVLLGRVMSLVKKHIDLDEPHLWVVYPRTRNKDSQLHAQIVGVWEPEKLNRDGTDNTDETESVSPSTAQSDADPSSAEADDGSGESSHETSGVGLDGTSLDASTAETSEQTIEPETDITAAADETPAATPPTDAADVTDAEAIATAAQSSPSASTTATDSTANHASASEESHLQGDASAQSSETAADMTPASAESLSATQPSKAPVAAPAPSTKPDGSPEMLHDGYFSIRGEITKYSPDENQLTVKIRQAPRKAGSQPKAFNLVVQGALEGRTVGYFWDLDVQRQGNNLVVQDGSMIRLVPPSKSKRKGGKPSRKSSNRRGGSGKPGSNRPPSKRSGHSDTPKPIRRNSTRSKSSQSKQSSNGAPSSESQGDT